MDKMLNIVKIGGNVVNDPEALKEFIGNFASLPAPKILVHGGGREATQVSAALGIETTMIDGRRVTDAATLDVVTMVYAGLINKRIVSALQASGCNAAGLSGADGGAVKSVRRQAQPVDYGFVGDVPDKGGVNVDFFTSLIEQGIVPVVCAITHDGNGQLLNTNADSVATAIAKAMSERFETTLTFCFEMPGVLRDVSDASSVIRCVTSETFEQLRADGVISGGMLPKVTGALAAVKAGVGSVLIVNHAQLLDSDAGTRIVL